MAQRLGVLSGRGALEKDGDLLGAIDYSLEVFQTNGRKESTGVVAGNFGMLVMAFEHGAVTLRLENAGEARIIITKLNNDRAAIRVDGPIPGF